MDELIALVEQKRALILDHQPTIRDFDLCDRTSNYVDSVGSNLLKLDSALKFLQKNTNIRTTPLHELLGVSETREWKIRTGKASLWLHEYTRLITLTGMHPHWIFKGTDYEEFILPELKDEDSHDIFLYAGFLTNHSFNNFLNITCSYLSLKPSIFMHKNNIDVDRSKIAFDVSKKYYKFVSENFKAFRSNLGLSREFASERLGISNRSLKRIEEPPMQKHCASLAMRFFLGFNIKPTNLTAGIDYFLFRKNQENREAILIDLLRKSGNKNYVAIKEIVISILNLQMKMKNIYTYSLAQ